jgi:hypothetical protein
VRKTLLLDLNEIRGADGTAVAATAAFIPAKTATLIPYAVDSAADSERAAY